MDAANAGVALWISLHVVALVAAYGTRVATGSYLEGVVQIVFYALMALIGARNLGLPASSRRRLGPIRRHADRDGTHGRRRFPKNG